MKPLQIAVDGRSLRTIGGVSVYTKELMRSLASIESSHVFNLFIWKKRDFTDQNSKIVLHSTLIPGRLANFIWKRLPILPMDRLVKKVDIFFSPNFTLPYLSKGIKSVITVHDLAFMRMPENVTESSRSFLNYWVSRSIHAADRIISVSHNTKRDIIELFGIPEKRIDVVHCACDTRFRVLEPEWDGRERLRAKYGLPERFLLYHGTLEPRKNIPLILHAFAKAKGELGDMGLVISGKKGWLYDEIFNTVQLLGISKDVCFPGYIEDADLPGLYNACEFFVFVSKYEGFGLPLLEAMSCGKAVIISDSSSLPEIAGGAALQIADTDEEGLSRAMIALAKDSKLREAREAASLRRARDFSWEATARKTLSILESVESGS
jgi:glycosyltransferase involved in cell wall biosynthesis